MIRNQNKKIREQKKAFKELLEPVYAVLFTFIYSLTKNKVLTDDALQNTLVKAYERFHQLKEKEKFKWWLFGIAKNEVIDMYRKYNQKPEDFLEEDLLHKLYADEDTAEEIILRDETKHQLIHEINRLKSIYRETVILHYYYELSFDEISTILQVNANTIRTRHARGKKYLYERLKDLDGENLKEGVKG